jgi:hypothetical protein
MLTHGKLCLHKNLYTNVYNSIIQNSPKCKLSNHPQNCESIYLEVNSTTKRSELEMHATAWMKLQRIIMSQSLMAICVILLHDILNNLKN